MNDVRTLWSRARELDAAGTSYALVTVVRAVAPTSARVGDKALVAAEGILDGWIGGGCAQPAVIRTVRQALADGRPRHIRITPERSGEQVIEDIIEFGMTCHSGGTIELFIDPVLAAPRLLVLGASPVARTLAQLAPQVGFDVGWIGADAGAVPEGARALPEGEAVPAGAYVVVATQGMQDLKYLTLALSLRARHIAFVASRKKGELLKEQLIAKGQDDAAVRAIEAPAGHAIGAHTPQEIALSVLAALVARRRGASTAPAVDEAPAARSLSRVAVPAATASCCGGEAQPAAKAAASCCGTEAEAPAVATTVARRPTSAPTPEAAPAAKASCCGGG
jgi:xanthine dehydrogenase accessory factor